VQQLHTPRTLRTLRTPTNRSKATHPSNAILGRILKLKSRTLQVSQAHNLKRQKKAKTTKAIGLPGILSLAAQHSRYKEQVSVILKTATSIAATQHSGNKKSATKSIRQRLRPSKATQRTTLNFSGYAATQAGNITKSLRSKPITLKSKQNKKQQYKLPAERSTGLF